MKAYTRIYSLILLFFVLIHSGYAQNKKFSLEDISINRDLYPQRLVQLQWIPETDFLTHVKNNELICISAADKKEKTLLNLSQLNQALKQIKKDTASRFPQITWENMQQFNFSINHEYYSYHIPTQKLELINVVSQNSENIDAFHNSKILAYTKENNLYVAHNNQQIAVAQEENKGIVFGQAVHRNEWGIEKGTFWSPAGDKLAFYRMDETMVTDYPLVHVEPTQNRVAELENIKYPMAGMTSHQVTVGIFDLKTQKTHYIQTGEPKEQYLTSVTWSPDGKYVFIVVLNRAQNHLKLNQYNAEDGMFIKTILEEKQDKWVEPEHGLYFIPNTNNHFLWFSERDNWMHLYRYDITGKLIGQVTKGKYGVTDIVGIDKKGKYVVLMATKESPLDLDAYKVDFTTLKMTKITNGNGVHYIVPNADCSYFIDNYSNPELPNRYQITDLKGKVINSIFTSSNPLKDYAIGKSSIITLKSNKGDDLYCRIITPADMDSTKKYPVFYYVYGGPHTQLVTNSWLGGANLFLHYMAMRGYVVFVLDNHGTPNRGLEFEQAIHRNLGTIELDDQMCGVKYLKSLKFVDSTRMGINGWSYGGFMTISLMTKYPGVFKAGVAGGPVIDWRLYEVMYGERYMDTPEENPNGYAQSNLLKYVKNLDGRLMIIHGTIDPTVVWQHSLLYVKEAVKKGVLLDYFVYPEHPHNVGGKDRIHLNRKIEQYMNDFVK